MSNNRDCAEYLKKNNGYHRCMIELEKKWRSHGRAAGKIVLSEATEDEKRSLSGIIGRRFTNSSINFSFQEFEQGLQNTKFAPINMQAVLENYFDCEMITNQKKQQNRQNEKNVFFEKILLAYVALMGDMSDAVLWIRDMQKFKKYGYHILFKEYEKDQDNAYLLIQNVGKALCKLESMREGEDKLLAVFSAEISGTPHYFDMGKAATQLLTYAICHKNGCEYPSSAKEWRLCLAEVGIISDNIASMVHAYGLRIETEDGIHEGYDGFRKRKEPYVITGENMKHITGIRAEDKSVYVVENEMVFLYLLEHMKNQEISCLCTSGQLRVVAFQVLDLLIASGVTIYYSGDLDAEGMGIADRLWQKYGESIQLWRMDKQDYKASISKECLSERQLQSLLQLKNPQLQKVAKLLMKDKCAGYQENILELLVSDLMK